MKILSQKKIGSILSSGSKTKSKSKSKIINSQQYAVNKNYRWKKEKEKQDKENKSTWETEIKESCDNLLDLNDLKEKLKDCFPLAITNPNREKFNLHLFSYCNEVSKLQSNIEIISNLDNVNRAFTSHSVINILENTFKVNINPAFGISGIIDKSVAGEKGKASEESSPNRFDENLCKFVGHILKEDRNKKGIFIVSHSGFMTSLVKFYVEQNIKFFTAKDELNDSYYPGIAFDNLDILHLQYNKKTGKIVNLTKRKFSDRYREPDTEYEGDPELEPSAKVDEPIVLYEGELREYRGHKVRFLPYQYKDVKYKYRKLEESVPEEPVGSPVFNIFIMRHCLGCHNISEGKLTKVGTLWEQVAKIKKNRGYLDWAMCLRGTFADMQYRQDDIKRLLQKYCFDVFKPFNLKDIIFGSSVIFRAMLTSILLYRCLALEKVSIKRIGGKKTKRKRKGRHKVKKSVKNKK
jgi:hypothetical protein